MKTKPVFVSIAVLGILLLVLSLGKVAQVWATNPRDVWKGTKAQPLTAQVLPKRSPLFVSLLVNPDRVSLLAQLATPPSDRRKLRQELNDFKQQLQNNWLLDYEKDIQPWLGEELSYAVTDLDLDHQPSNGLQTGHLLTFLAKDSQKAKTTLNKFWQKLAVNGSTLGFEQYQGESIVSTLVETESSALKAIASVTLDKFVLFADDLRVLRQAIDTLKSPSSALASFDNYRDRLQQIAANKIGIVYANLPQDQTNQLPVNLLASFAVAKAGDQVGLQVHSQFNNQVNNQTNGNTDGGQGNVSGQSTPKQSALNLARAIPKDSSFILGKDLHQTIQNLESFLLPQSALDSPSGAIDKPNLSTQAIAKLLGIDPASLTSQTLAWAANDYAIALIPNAAGTQDWLIVADSNSQADRSTSDVGSASLQSLEQLDQLVSNQLTVGKVAVQSQPVTVWTKLKAIASKGDSSDLSGTLVAAHAQIGQYIYFSNSLTTLEIALNLSKKQAIASDRHFQKLLAKLPQDAVTYSYLNQERSPLDLEQVWLQVSKTPKTQKTQSLLTDNLLIKKLRQHLKVAGIAITPIDISSSSNNSDSLDPSQSTITSINSDVFLAIQ